MPTSTHGTALNVGDRALSDACDHSHECAPLPPRHGETIAASVLGEFVGRRGEVTRACLTAIRVAHGKQGLARQRRDITDIFATPRRLLPKRLTFQGLRN